MIYCRKLRRYLAFLTQLRLVVLRFLQFIHRFKDPLPEPVINKTYKEIRDARKKHRAARAAARLQKQIDKCAHRWPALSMLDWTHVLRAGDPKKIENATSDAYKTLFVARLVRMQSQTCHFKRVWFGRRTM